MVKNNINNLQEYYMEECRARFIDCCGNDIDDYNMRTVKELMKICKTLKLKNYSRLTKKEIVDLIFQHKSNFQLDCY